VAAAAVFASEAAFLTHSLCSILARLVGALAGSKRDATSCSKIDIPSICGLRGVELESRSSTR